MKSCKGILLIVIIIDLSKATQNITDVAIHIANKGFDLRKMTIVAWQGDNEVVNYFLQGFNGTVITTDMFNNEVDVHSEQYVFFGATSAEEFDYYLTIIKEEQVRPVRAILVLLEPSLNNEDLREITRACLKKEITDLVIIHKPDKDEEVKLTTYYPKSDGNCENFTPITFNASEVANYFPRKFKNFFGCPLRVSFLDWPPYVIVNWDNGTIVSITGTEGCLVHLLVSMLNATLDAVFPSDSGNFGILNSYGHWTGTIGDLIYGRADVSATSAITNLDRFRAVQLTHSYKTMSIIWCAPNQVEIRAWAKVLVPLFTNITVFLVISCMAFVIACACVQRYQLHGKVDKPTLFYSWAIFFGQNVKFETASWLLNSLFVLWLWFCLILRIAYQGELVKDLEKVILEPPLRTFMEALKVIDNYGGTDSVLTFYKDSPIEDNYIVLNLADIQQKVESIVHGEKFLLALDKWKLHQYGSKVQMLEEPVVQSPVSLLIRRRWAASREFDKLLLRIFESGVYDKIMSDYITLYNLKDYKEFVAHDFNFVPLDFLHLSGCFYGLLIECVFCCFLLCLENAWFKWKHSGVNINKHPD